MNSEESFEWRDTAPKRWVQVAQAATAVGVVYLLGFMVWIAVNEKPKPNWLLLLPVGVSPLLFLVALPPVLWRGRAIRIDYRTGVVEFRRVLVLSSPWSLLMPVLFRVRFADMVWVRTERGQWSQSFEVLTKHGRILFASRPTPELAECRQRLVELCPSLPSQRSKDHMPVFVACMFLAGVIAFLIAMFF